MSRLLLEDPVKQLHEKTVVEELEKRTTNRKRLDKSVNTRPTRGVPHVVICISLLSPLNTFPIALSFLFPP